MTTSEDTPRPSIKCDCGRPADFFICYIEYNHGHHAAVCDLCCADLERREEVEITQKTGMEEIRK